MPTLTPADQATITHIRGNLPTRQWWDGRDAQDFYDRDVPALLAIIDRLPGPPRTRTHHKPKE